MRNEQEPMTILRASETGRDLKPEISAVFADGFYQRLKYFSKDKQKLANSFTHMFDQNVFFVVMSENTVAGVAACTDGRNPPIHLDKRELRRVLGLVSGSFAYIMLKKKLEDHRYPFEVEPRTGSVEFVATSPEYRGQGVAALLIRNMMSSSPYDEYVLEVADTNTTAVRLYERLGFREFMRVKEPNSKRSGINHLVYMKAIKPVDAGPFYHGTKAGLNIGDLIQPGYDSNHGARKKANFVYMAATLDAAIWGAELAVGDGRGRIYRVEPTGAFEDDPNLTDKKFPGNLTRSYRTRHPLRVTDEVLDWEGHPPEVLQNMLDGLAELKRQGVEAIE